MKAIVGARRGDLLYLNPKCLFLDWEQNYCRPGGAKEANIDEMVEQILAPAINEKGEPTGKITGIKEPISVRALKGQKSADGTQLFEVVKGFRRATAALRIAKDHPKLEVPAIRWTGDAVQRIVDNLTENDAREAIGPLGRAAVFGKLAEEHKWSADTIAKALGRAADFVRDHIKLLKAPPELRKMLASGELTWANARQALRVEPEEIVATAEKLKGLTAPQARASVSATKEKKERKAKGKDGASERKISLREWLEQKIALMLGAEDNETNRGQAKAFKAVLSELARRQAA